MEPRLKKYPHRIFVCVTFDQHLSFRPHILTINNKLAKSVGIINKVKHYLPKQVLMTLYYTLVYPYLTYCCAVWSSNYQSNLSRIIIYQKKVVRIITRSEYDAHTTPIFRQLRILKFEDIAAWSILKIVYIYHQQAKTEYNRLDLFTVNERNTQRYRIPFGRLNTTRFCISYRGPILWNPLNNDLKKLPSIHRFKKQFFNIAFEKYE